MTRQKASYVKVGVRLRMNSSAKAASGSVGWSISFRLRDAAEQICKYGMAQLSLLVCFDITASRCEMSI